MEYLILAILIAINAFFAAGELAIVSVRKVRIKQLADDGNRAARAVLRLSDNPRRFLATIQIGVTLTAFFASAFGAVNLVKTFEDLVSQVAFLKPFASTLAFVLETVFVAFFTLIFGELVPKTLAVEAAESIALTVARPIELIAKIASPLIALLTGTTNLIVRLLGGKRKVNTPSVTQEEIVSMVTAGQEEGVFQPQQEEIIRSVFDFSEKRVREVMRPRREMNLIDASWPLSQAAPVIADSDYSRYPVFTDTHENITGIVFAKDVLRAYVIGQTSETIREIARPPLFVPESKHISELFTDLQNSRNHMAIVIDEYGGVAGLVTLEDLLEELVGEIQDEFDHEENALNPVGNNEYIANGRVSLFDLNAELGLELGLNPAGERADVVTLAGLVMAELKHIPKAGEMVRIALPGAIPQEKDDNYQTDEGPQPVAVELRVLKMDGLQVDEINLKIFYPPEADNATELKPVPSTETEVPSLPPGH